MSRMKPQQEIYRPGSGRLKKSGQGIESSETSKFDCFSDNPVENRNQEQRYLSKMSKGNSGSSNEINKLSDNFNNLSIPKSELGTSNLTDKRKNKKPEKAIYIPKPIAHSSTGREFGDKPYNENRNLPDSVPSQVTPMSRSDIKNQSYKSNNNLNRDMRNGCNNFGSTDRLNSNSKRSRRNHRRHTQEIDYKSEQDNWRTSSPSVQPRTLNRRDYRQSSEPRTIEPLMDPNRMRDTRSVEPVDTSGLTRIWQPGKIQNKPPSGRRNSSISLCGEREIMNKVQKPPTNLDSLPPRLRKKYLAENGYNVTNYSSNCEGTWDGSSITFQGTSTEHYSQTNPNKMDTQINRNMNISYTPMSNIHEQHNLSHAMIHGRGVPRTNQTYMSQTLPNMRSRGRGRLRIEDMEIESQQKFMHRPHTPDPVYFNSPYNSRPNTPPNYSNFGRTYSNEQLNYGYNRTQTPTQEQQTKFKKPFKVPQTTPQSQVITSEQLRKENVPVDLHLSPVSPPTPPSQPILSTKPEILDWSEEVELHAEIEEALSDAMTRSSSMASLTDPLNNTHSRSERRNNRKSRRKRDRSKRSSSRNERVQRDQSLDNKNSNNKNFSNQERTRQENEKTQNLSQVKVSQNRNYNCNNQHGPRTNSNDRNRNRRYSRDSSNDRSRKNSECESKNWRERRNSEKDSCNQAPGILVLPKEKYNESSHNQNVNSRAIDSYQSISRSNIQPAQHINPQHVNPQQKILFDPNNPNKPIFVTASNTRTGFSESNSAQSSSTNVSDNQVSIADNSGPAYITDQFGNVRLPWYDPLSKNFHASHNPRLIIEIERVDLQLQWIINSGGILRDWKRVLLVRQFLQQSLQELLKTDLKFCQTENVEYHFWKILFYNIIEVMRKSMVNDAEHKTEYKEIMLYIIEDGSKYLEGLLQVLETTHSFKLSDFLGSNNTMPPKGLGFVGLALISAQKIYLFLGDLARYKEEVNETTNYWKSREWYIKAQEINPKNGRPYNQLAILAMYSRKRLDAVYYYMRSLMSSNPFHSARERLTALFDDIRKKYEQGQRKRREERAERLRLQMKEREKTVGGNSLRRETWVHPEDGRRLHRTTNAQPQLHLESDDDLSKLSCSDVNKRFVISYLHIQGKLVTRIGMESFQEAALQTLKEFRALLQHSPMPLNCKRLLKLLALNMFAIENSQLKDAQLDQGYRSEVQECALIVSLQMFNLILERCVILLKEQIEQPPDIPYTRVVNEDMQTLLPAVKVWCDWMLCHNYVWNPPPSCSDYRVGPPGDAWSRLATLMNLLKKLDYHRAMLVTGPKEGYEPVRLTEDSILCGFTPLMYNTKETMYVSNKEDMEVAQICLRIHELIFFGTEFLCGQDPPVLKLQKFESGHSEYISVVSATNRSGDVCEPHDDGLSSGSDILVESFSEDEDDTQDKDVCLDINDATTPEEIRGLLQRKEELERKQERQERHRQRVQAILQQSVVSVEIEIRPHYLVPDTNCFIDYLSQLQSIAKVQINAQPVYILMIPLIVLNELEGLARGGRTPTPVTRASLDPQHVVRVAEASRRALDFLHAGRNPAVRCVTTRGTILPTTNAMVEEDEEGEGPQRNDDRILTTALRLCRPQQNKDQQAKDGEPRRLVRDVVLLTDDRNLRVKALSRDVPVRELPDFMKWAGLG